MDSNKRKVGRPKGYSPCGTVKGQSVRVYLDGDELAKLRAVSELAGESMSETMRRALRALPADRV